MAVEYMNGDQLLTVITNTTAQVAGTSAVDTARALAAESYRLNAGEKGVISFPYTVIKGGTPITLEAAYASQLWDYWKITGGAAVSAIGTAAAGAATWAQGVLFGNPELAGTLAGSGGLLTASLPATAAAIIPLLGVGFGGALYDLAPDFWEDVSRTLLPWAYEDTKTIPLVVDENGQVYADKAMVDALKQLLDEKGIGGVVGKISNLDTGNAPQPIPVGSFSFACIDAGRRTIIYTYTGNVCGFCRDTGYAGHRTIYVSTTSPAIVTRTIYNSTTGTTTTETFSGSTAYTYNGKTVYYGLTSTSLGDSIISYSGARLPFVSSLTKPGEVAWTMIYGNNAGGYPDGAYQWGGTSVDYTQLPTIPVVSSTDGSTTPYVPITLHGGDQTATADPSLYPDPTATLTDLSLLDPYISPVVSQIQWPQELPEPSPLEITAPQSSTDPLYLPEPDLYPANDPSALPDIEPAKELPTNLTNPISGGQSPDPIFPVPDVPFPCWTPTGSAEPVVSGQPGFIQIYHPSPSEFISFGRWLWVTYGDSTIDKIWNNPFDGVIGAHELYATPADGGYSTIRCGFLDSGISTQVVNQRYTQINCGSIVIPEYWGNYLDYSPYSQAMIYLPFIGIVNLEVDDIVGAAVNVLYHVDSYTGSCIAQITVAKDDYSNTLYQFAGNCSVEIPMAGGSQAQIKAALMTANAYQNAANVSANLTGLGGIGSGIASALGGLLSGGAIGSTGNFAGGMSAAIGGAASGVSQIIHGYTGAKSQQVYGEAQHTANMLSGKAIVQHSGSFGSSHGAMGIKKPYLIIRRPIQKVVNGYQELYGFPAHKQVIIGSCTGYLRCREVHVVSSLATDAEKNQIESLLKGGVYVTES